MENKLILTDNDGNLIRAFHAVGENITVVRRHDTRRLEIVEDLSEFEKNKIQFEKLGSLQVPHLKSEPFFVGQLGKLQIVEKIDEVVLDAQAPQENEKIIRKIAIALILLAAAVLTLMLNIPQNTEKIKKEMEQQVVKIIKMAKPQPQVVTANQGVQRNKNQVDPKVVTPTKDVKRLGALAVLGSLNSGKQKGGLNLGAVSTTRGPGLGGTEGSGGVQTSLYGKGIVSAPLGAGQNVQGAGGYGTKGKGGGQEGFGKLSLIGSAGGSAIALGDEANVASGLDRDQIAEVIQRNIGQVRFCYEQGLQGNPALSGRVAMNFVINKAGQVSTADVANTTINNKVIEDCLMMRLKSWKFPLPQGGVEVKVTFPFVLRRTGQG